MGRPGKNPGPRIFCIPATASPILAVLSRGPSSWYHVGLWNVEDWTHEPGAWFRGRLFPQKCDLSPDGRWLAYSAHQPSARWPAGTIYEAISRLPWLHALAAWEAGTTYTRGIRFDEEAGSSDLGAPDVGDATARLRRYGVRLNRACQFAVERRRGWVETEGSGPRDPKDDWDERRTVRMSKEQPKGSGVRRRPRRRTCRAPRCGSASCCTLEEGATWTWAQIGNQRSGSSSQTPHGSSRQPCRSSWVVAFWESGWAVSWGARPMDSAWG